MRDRLNLKWKVVYLKKIITKNNLRIKIYTVTYNASHSLRRWIKTSWSDNKIIDR